MAERYIIIIKVIYVIGFVSVFVGQCRMCGAEVYADGDEAGILNMGNFLVCHQFLRQYCSPFVTNG